MASDCVRLAVAQVNTKVGGVEENLQSMIVRIEEAKRQGANLIVFPEMTLAGYPPEDLLFRESFIRRMQIAAEAIEPYSDEAMIVFGYAEAKAQLANVAAVVAGGRRVATLVKNRLPNYGVFDEYRYFAPGDRTEVIAFGPFSLGVSICEDMWYPDGPYLAQARSGANLLINISASPYARGKGETRERMLRTRAEDTGSFLVWSNLVGAQDELVFDGRSLVVAPDGSVLARAAAFAEELLCVELHAGASVHRRWLDPRSRGHHSAIPVPSIITVPFLSPPSPRARWSEASIAEMPGVIDQLYQALVLGIRDYVRKTGFSDVVIGISGGIDSAVTAALACEALTADHVRGVFMPSSITSTESRHDACGLAENLGITLLDVPISEPMTAYLTLLQPHFGTRPADLTEENLQARIRGVLLMALSNKLGWLVLTTGNKSEMATGYSTLYGDMAGGFAVLKDVLKMEVFQLAEWMNRDQTIIPANILSKPPSAELRPDQRDEDSLPPYAILDQILRGYIEDDLSPAEMVALGLPEPWVALTVKLVDHNEYKRRQAPVGIRVTPRAFGRDRRMPISGTFS